MSEVDATLVALRAEYNRIWMQEPCYRNYSPEYELLRGLPMREWRTKGLKSFLSVGCGIGHGLQYARTLGYAAQGTDLADQLQQFYTPPSLFTAAPAHELPFDAGTFDIVSCVDVLEHISPGLVGASLREIARVGKQLLVLGVCCVPSQLIKGLHLTVHEASWWLDRFEQLGTILSITGNHIKLNAVVRLEG